MKKCERMVGAVLDQERLFVLAMAAIFAFQASKSVLKYCDEKVVEEVTMEQSAIAVMPPLTICTMPGVNSALDLISYRLWENYCPRGTADFKRCFEDLSIKRKEMLFGSYSFPAYAVLMDETNFDSPPPSFSLVLGSCFTFQVKQALEMSQITINVLSFNMTQGSYFDQGWTLAIFVHNEGQFLPSVGVAPEYAGQHVILYSPKLYGFGVYQLTKYRRIRRNTKSHRCVEEPDYNIVQCMEEYVHRMVNCSSPWDLFPSQVPECKSFEEFERLYNVHGAIYNSGSPQFQKETGCLPPCEYDDFDVQERDGALSESVFSYIGEVAQVGICLSSTNVWVIRDTWLYGFERLLGEVGGCLGLFLGVSFVSAYQFALTVLNIAVEKKY